MLDDATPDSLGKRNRRKSRGLPRPRQAIGRSGSSSIPSRRKQPVRNWFLSTPPHHTHPLTMASIIGRAAFRATRPIRASGVNSGAENAASQASREADKQALKQGARKDPELYVRRHFLCAL